jgi:PAS domain S-box-containing protein
MEGRSKRGPIPADIRFGHRMRERRMMLGLSQTELGAALGVTFQQIQKYERGINRVSAGTLQMLAATLRVPIPYFFDGSPAESDQPTIAEGQDVEREDESLRLQEISTLLIQEGDLEALHKRVLDAAINLMSADMGSMQRFYPEQHELQLLAWKGFHPYSAAFWERVHLESASASGAALSIGHRIMVPDVEASDFMAGTIDLHAYRQSGIRAVQSTPLVSRSGRLLGMISTHWRKPHQPTERAFRLLDVLARQAADLIERTQVEAALRESEQRFRWFASIVESSEDAIVSKDIAGIITTWNNGAERLFGYTSDEIVGKPVTFLIPADRHVEERAILERIRRGERIENYETVRRRKDGSLVDVSLTISPVMNAEGTIVGASKIARDITRRKRAERREKMLMADLDHRVRNSLARVAMLAASSRRDSCSVDEFAKSLDGRIHSMAAALTLLSERGEHGVGLGALVHNQLAPHAAEANITIRGTELMLAPVAIQAMGMVLHELVTNAAKYGALSVPTGQVSVSWERRQNGSAGAHLILMWRESGGPPIAAEVKPGYGTRLIRELVPYELGGTVDLVFAPEGVSCRIEFPLPASETVITEYMTSSSAAVQKFA